MCHPAQGLGGRKGLGSHGPRVSFVTSERSLLLDSVLHAVPEEAFARSYLPPLSFGLSPSDSHLWYSEEA